MTKCGISVKKAKEIKLRNGIKKTGSLEKLRLKKGISQNKLAELVNITPSTIRSYEQGRRSIDSARLDKLCDLADTLDCKISDLIEDKELKSKYNKVK